MTISQAYKKAVYLLNTEEREQEAAEILCNMTGFDKGELFLNFSNDFPYEKKLEKVIERRLKGEPLAYILNVRSFYGYDFYVDERCLIPRYDSECVAERAVLLAHERGYKKVLDLCSGSGCLGISVLLELRNSGHNDVSVDFSDISYGANEVLIKNARCLLGYEPNCFLGNLYIPKDEKYDLIICNPPYIDIDLKYETEKQVVNYEPHIALFASNKGLELYTEIAKKSRLSLNDDGALICEIGYDQADAVKEIFKQQGFKNVKSGCDLACRDRFVSGDV